jgi:sugar lactone lactonase YvrE
MKPTGIPSIMPSRSAESSSRCSKKLYVLPVIATVLFAHYSFAAAPSVVTDAQQTVGTGIASPQAVAVAPNGTIYVADSSRNRIYQIIPNLPATSTPVAVTTPALTDPLALAVDAAGDLYISDVPNFGFTARVTEIVANSSGALTAGSTVKTLYSGALLTYPLSLAVGSDNTVYVGDFSFAGGGVDYIPSGGTLHTLSISGISGTFIPSGLAVSGSNLFIADLTATGDGVFVAPVSTGAAKPVLMGTFTTQNPEGLAVDGAGDLFVLATPGGSSGEQVIEIPNPSAVSQSSPYFIPNNGLTSSSAIAVDSAGNVDLIGGSTSVTQLNFLNPVYLGAASVYQAGTAITFNFEFNAPARFTGLRAMTVGDVGSTSDVAQVTSRTGGNCAAQTLTGQTATQPYTCYRQFEADAQYVGTRSSSIQVLGSGSTVLDSTSVYELGQAAAQIAYPLDTVTTQLGLIQPQGIAISGFDQTVYVADYLSAQVYSISGLNGSAKNTVSTGSITLSAPSAVAMNGEGDLFIADFNLHEVIVVPTTTGIAPYILNTGSLLQHPIALALDALGDLYIGDAGSDGDAASSSNPGFVVEVPYSGAAFLLPTNGVSIVFPQALAFNNNNGVLAIGDGGDEYTALGQVVEVTANGTASVVSISNPAPSTDPSGLSFDAAGNLYVLDGAASTVTEVYTDGSTALLPISIPSALWAPSALAASAGSQSFVIANLGGGAENSLVYLNGNSASLAFGNQTVNTTSASQAVTVANIGNQNLILNSAWYSPQPVDGFPLGSGTCAARTSLTSLTSCSFAFQFAPTVAKSYSKSATINSNAYNSGTPIVNLTGTGTATVKGNVTTTPAARRSNRAGRKSFALARSR